MSKLILIYQSLITLLHLLHHQHRPYNAINLYPTLMLLIRMYLRLYHRILHPTEINNNLHYHRLPFFWINPLLHVVQIILLTRRHRPRHRSANCRSPLLLHLASLLTYALLALLHSAIITLAWTLLPLLLLLRLSIPPETT